MWQAKGGNGTKKGAGGGGAAGNGLVAVAIDNQKGSQNALRWAAENVITRGQTVILLHVVQKSSSTSSCNLSLSCNQKSNLLLR